MYKAYFYKSGVIIKKCVIGHKSGKSTGFQQQTVAFNRTRGILFNTNIFMLMVRSSVLDVSGTILVSNYPEQYCFNKNNYVTRR